MRLGPRLYINVMIQLLIREYHIYIVSAKMDMERECDVVIVYPKIIGSMLAL